jgi:hypothetical protein
MGGKTGPEKRQKNLDRRWFREFGVNAGIVTFGDFAQTVMSGALTRM